MKYCFNVPADIDIEIEADSFEKARKICEDEILNSEIEVNKIEYCYCWDEIRFAYDEEGNEVDRFCR